MGSKSKIIPIIGPLFTPNENFYDLFGGGFSVTHYMAENRFRQFKKFHYNEIRPGMCELIQRAIAGDYSYDKFKMPWVSKQEFFAKKDTDAFIKIIWSFGNDGDSYLFGEDIEQHKRSLHMAIVFDEFDDYAKKVIGFEKWPANVPIKGRRLFVRNRVIYLKNNKEGELQQLERLQQLQQLEQLQRLERLQQLERLNNLISFSNLDYRKVQVKPNSTIYCDIPYKGTSEYDGSFNHKEFYDWAANNPNPVYVSEYKIDDPRFILFKEITVKSTKSANGPTSATERLYANSIAAKFHK